MILSDRRLSLESLATVGIVAPKEGTDGMQFPPLNTITWKRSKAEAMFNMLLGHEHPALYKYTIMLPKFDHDEHEEARGELGRLKERVGG